MTSAEGGRKARIGMHRSPNDGPVRDIAPRRAAAFFPVGEVLRPRSIQGSPRGATFRGGSNDSRLTLIQRTDTKLRGRFHSEYPDDVQVIVHDGGPRLTDRLPELVWVRITGCSANVFRGLVLNQPRQLLSVSPGAEISFVVPDSGEHPLMVSDKYLAERRNWVIQPCAKCGLSELFDAPSDLQKIVFPSMPPDATMKMFTAFCGLCGGVQVVQHKDAVAKESQLRQG